MSARRFVAALLAATVSACAPGALVRPVSGASPSPAAKASEKPGATPSASPTPRATPSAATGGALLPAPGTRALRGTIKVEAAYFVSSAGGRLIGESGGAVRLGSASVVANNGSNLIASNGSSLLTNNGAGLLSDKGAGLTAKAKLALLAEPDAPAPGELRPAAGMLVGLVDLRTGALVPVGRDEAGTPAFGVYSDAQGGYTLHVPESMRGNVAVLAVPPDASQDRRLVYALLTPVAGTGPVAIDEETALVSRFMRRAFLSRLTAILVAEEVDPIINLALPGAEYSKPLVEAIRPILREMNREARAAGLHQLPPAEAELIAQRGLDVILARADFDAMIVSKDINPNWSRPPIKAFELFVEILRGAREKTAETLRRDPGYFARQQWLETANFGRPPEARYEIKKAADLGDFVLTEYMTRSGSTYAEIQTVFDGIGFGEKVVHDAEANIVGNRAVDQIASGATAVLVGIFTALVTDADGAYTTLIDTLRAARRS